MNNEVLARAITEIDDELIAQAHEKPTAIRVRKNRKWLSVCAAAACLALVISGVSYRQWQTRLSISIGGDTVSDRAVIVEAPAPASADARKTMPDRISVPLEITAHSTVTLEAIDGTIAVCDTQSGEPLGDGAFVTASGDLTVTWTVDNPAANAAYLLKINNRTLVLSFVEDNWVISQQT